MELERILLDEVTVIVDVLVARLALPLPDIIADMSSIALETAEEGLAEALLSTSVEDAIALSETRLPAAGSISTPAPAQSHQALTQRKSRLLTKLIADSGGLLLISKADVRSRAKSRLERTYEASGQLISTHAATAA